MDQSIACSNLAGPLGQPQKTSSAASQLAWLCVGAATHRRLANDLDQGTAMLVGRHSGLLPLSFSAGSVGLQCLCRSVNTAMKVSTSLLDLRDFNGG